MGNGIIFNAAMAEKRLEKDDVKYSAAYSTGRELMLEPLYGCAEEALLRRVASPKCTCAAGIRFPDERSEEPCVARSQEGARVAEGDALAGVRANH